MFISLLVWFLKTWIAAIASFFIGKLLEKWLDRKQNNNIDE